MTDAAIALTWATPTSGKLVAEAPAASGVYMWGFDLSAFRSERIGSITHNNHDSERYVLDLDWTFIPYYIGKAASIRQRLSSHRRELPKGKYRIFHKEVLQSFNRYQYDPPQVIDNLDNFKVYKRWLKDPSIYEKFDRNRFDEHSTFMIDNMVFTFAETPYEFRGCIESILKKQIRVPIIEEKKSACNKVNIRHVGDESIGRFFELQ